MRVSLTYQYYCNYYDEICSRVLLYFLLLSSSSLPWDILTYIFGISNTLSLYSHIFSEVLTHFCETLLLLLWYIITHIFGFWNTLLLCYYEIYPRKCFQNFKQTITMRYTDVYFRGWEQTVIFTIRYILTYLFRILYTLVLILWYILTYICGV